MTEILDTQSIEDLEMLSFKQEISNLKKEAQASAKDLGPAGREKKESLPCPFPDHKGYSEVWKNLTPEQQKQMQENIRITPDGKVEIVKMKKKFSVLTAAPNNVDIFDGSHKDKNGKTGIAGVTYLTSRVAEKECTKQNKKLLKNEAEVKQFISYFPGKDEKEKILNFAQLFGLRKAGFWNPIRERWNNVGSVGSAIFSEVDQNGYVHGAEWNDGYASIGRHNQLFSSRFVACEDIIPKDWSNSQNYIMPIAQQQPMPKPVDKKAEVTKVKVEKKAEIKEVKVKAIEETETKPTNPKEVLKPDTNKAGRFMMPDGKKYDYDTLIQNYPQFKDDKIFKSNFPGRERPHK